MITEEIKSTDTISVEQSKIEIHQTEETQFSLHASTVVDETNPEAIASQKLEAKGKEEKGDNIGSPNTSFDFHKIAEDLQAIQDLNVGKNDQTGDFIAESSDKPSVINPKDLNPPALNQAMNKIWENANLVLKPESLDLKDGEKKQVSKDDSKIQENRKSTPKIQRSQSSLSNKRSTTQHHPRQQSTTTKPKTNELSEPYIPFCDLMKKANAKPDRFLPHNPSTKRLGGNNTKETSKKGKTTVPRPFKFTEREEKSKTK